MTKKQDAVVPSLFFVMVANYWGSGSTLDDAWRNVRRESGKDRSTLERGTYFALEFPAGADVEISTFDGSWTAKKRPLRVVAFHGLDAKRVAELYMTCELSEDDRATIVNKLYGANHFDAVAWIASYTTITAKLQEMALDLANVKPGQSQKALDVIAEHLEALRVHLAA